MRTTKRQTFRRQPSENCDMPEIMLTDGVHQIQFCMTLEDKVRMSVVSKKWKTLLNSVPDSHYKIQTEIPSVLCCVMDRYDRKNAVEKRIQLTAWVDKSMGGL
ncbi:hypothetical protein COP2_025519 [Malus domestica]